MDPSEALVITRATSPNPDSLPVEIVERKGVGHPDTICDALTEELSIALTKFYHERVGRVLHHNVDKALLWAGSTAPRFGGGDVLEPMQIFLAGRATMTVDGLPVPVEDLANQAAAAWLSTHLHAVDPATHVRVRCLVRPGSEELVTLFQRASERSVGYANDSSCGVGYAPLSTLERVVLDVEKELTLPAASRAHPQIGEDVKVLGVRRGDHIDLTVACAMVDRFLANRDAYMEAKETIATLVSGTARRITNREVSVHVNTADDPTTDRYYLTVTGTSGEAGDDGQAGRGNRVGGLITPYRPMVMEAAAGKNPITHVGKSYGVVAHRIAQTVVDQLDEVDGANCLLVSRIGSPVNEPQLVEVQVAGFEPLAIEALRQRIEPIVAGELTKLQSLWEDTIRRAVRLY